MNRGRTPFQRWQLAGCPTIPAGKFNPWHGYFQSKINASSRKHEEQRLLDERSKTNAKQGFFSRAASAVGRFLSRRRG